jgi:hypothetical protein
MATHHIYSFRGDRIERVMHRASADPLAEGFAGCLASLAGMEPKPGGHAWAYSPVWCIGCFPGFRCARRVVDTYGRHPKACGQPSSPGGECRWHHDQRIERAA